MQQSQAKFVSSMIALAIAAVVATPAYSVILLDSPTRNTATPTDAGQASAYALVGQVGDFSGTPIAPNLFVAAKHATGLNQTFFFDGHGYTTTSYTDIAGTDLRIFQIDTSGGGFSRYASLYNAGASGGEAGKPLFVAGRGTPRGSVYSFNGENRGYSWGAADFLKSWGATAVDDVVHDDQYGDLVSFGFATSGVGLTSGDSGGGLFVYADGKWQLAGVNLGTDGAWSRTEAGPYENASIYDARGLYVGTASDHQLVPSDVASTGSSYASRISSNRAAINAIFLATGNAALVPEPTTLVTVIAAISLTIRRRRR